MGCCGAQAALLWVWWQHSSHSETESCLPLSLTRLSTKAAPKRQLGTGAARHQAQGGIWVFCPQDSHLHHLKHFNCSAQRVSLVPQLWVTHQPSEPNPWDQRSPAQTATVTHLPLEASPDTKQADGGVIHIHTGHTCLTVLQTQSTHTFLLPALPRPHSQARLNFFSMGKCWCIHAR